MSSITMFLAARLLTKSFWFLVLSTFLGVLMLAMRSFFRNMVYQDAVRMAPQQRFYGNRV